LAFGTEELLPVNGYQTVPLYKDPTRVGESLRQCDRWFELAIPDYVNFYLRDRILGRVAKPGDSTSPETEVVVKLSYYLKVWAREMRVYETEGINETTTKLDRQIRGHVTALERSYERNIFKLVRAQFRYLAADWLSRLPPSPSRQRALALIRQQLNQMYKPGIIADDELPASIPNIVASICQNGG